MAMAMAGAAHHLCKALRGLPRQLRQRRGHSTAHRGLGLGLSGRRLLVGALDTVRRRRRGHCRNGAGAIPTCTSTCRS